MFSLQTWLAETPEQARKGGTPGYISVGMACKILLLYAPDSPPEKLILTHLSYGCRGGRHDFIHGPLEYANILILRRICRCSCHRRQEEWQRILKPLLQCHPPENQEENRWPPSSGPSYQIFSRYPMNVL